MFQKRFFTCFSKIFKKFYLLFYVKKIIKECPVPLDISIKSNRKHHKTVLYSKSNKNMVGRLFGQFFIVFGQFFNKNIWSPCFPTRFSVNISWKNLFIFWQLFFFSFSTFKMLFVSVRVKKIILRSGPMRYAPFGGMGGGCWINCKMSIGQEKMSTKT